MVMENVMGLIINTPTDYKFGFIKLPIRRKHWVAIKCINGKYMNLDSKLTTPSPIGTESELLTFLRAELATGEKELLLIVGPEVYEKSLWRRDSNSNSSKEEMSTNDTKSNTVTAGIIAGDTRTHSTSTYEIANSLEGLTISEEKQDNNEGDERRKIVVEKPSHFPTLAQTKGDNCIESKNESQSRIRKELEVIS